TGEGIPKANLAKLFTPFFTTKPIGTGTGLGLSICHRLVTDAGGQISVESEPGRGTTFRVVLPPAAVAHVREVHRTPSLAAMPTRRARVLVVDDEPSIARAIQRMLSPFHDVTIFTHAQDA